MSHKRKRDDDDDDDDDDDYDDFISLDHLPSEILIEVFSYLNGKDLRAVSQVSRRWRSLGDHYLRLDILFVCDVTASADYWNDFKKDLIVLRENHQEIRLGFVGYRDHDTPNELITFHPFTFKRKSFISFIHLEEVKGGGDLPEALLDGLYFGLHLNWRPHSTKRIILMAEAPPHGHQGHQGRDLYPGGCPCGLREEFIFSLIKTREIRLTLFYPEGIDDLKGLYSQYGISSYPYYHSSFVTEIENLISSP